MFNKNQEKMNGITYNHHLTAISPIQLYAILLITRNERVVDMHWLDIHCLRSVLRGCQLYPLPLGLNRWLEDYS